MPKGVPHRKRTKAPDFHHNLQAAVNRAGGPVEVARFLGVKPFSVQNWCTGKAEPCLYDLQVLCLILEVEVHQLLGTEKTYIAEAQRLGVTKMYMFQRELQIEREAKALRQKEREERLAAKQKAAREAEEAARATAEAS